MSRRMRASAGRRCVSLARRSPAPDRAAAVAAGSRGARAAEPSADSRRPVRRAGRRRGRARGEVGVLSDGRRQRHRRRGAGRHPHRRRRPEQPDHPRPVRRRRRRSSQLVTDFGRTSRSGADAHRCARDAQQQDVGDRARRRAAAGRSRLFRRAAGAGGPARRAADRRRASAGRRSGRRALAQSGLKSGLDVSFAKVNLSEAQLLLVQARNDVRRRVRRAGRGARAAATRRPTS